MPPDQHVNPAEEPSSTSSPSRPEDPAADGTAFMPGVPRDPASLIRIPPRVKRIGRGPDNNIIVAELGVSKQHAELRRTPAGRCSIIDLGSQAGTYVNGTRISEQELRELNEGDIIAIGHATFRLAGGELVEYIDDGTDKELLAGRVWRVDVPVAVRPATPEEVKTALERERDLAAELRGQLDAREHRIDSLQDELRALAAANPAVLPVLDRLGIRPEPEA
jgi:pSer/pThr/pTyr-binding forkhead associated (FHA) protein